MEILALSANDDGVTTMASRGGGGFATFDLPLPLPAGARLGALLLAAAGHAGIPDPADEPRIVAALAAAIAQGCGWTEVEHRLRLAGNDTEQWLLTRFVLRRDGAGRPVAVTGLHLDITARHRDTLLAELVSRELAHRMRNVFAVVASILRLSLRGTPEAELQAQELGGRLAALSLAYRLLEPSADPDAPRELRLGALLGELMAPFEGGATLHMDADVADLAVSERAATGLALILHELASNAAKHGALAPGRGRLRLEALARPGAVLLRWHESLAVPGLREPVAAGFGSMLFDRLSADLFGAPMQRHWRPDGLQVELLLPLEQLVPA